MTAKLSSGKIVHVADVNPNLSERQFALHYANTKSGNKVHAMTGPGSGSAYCGSRVRSTSQAEATFRESAEALVAKGHQPCDKCWNR